MGICVAMDSVVMATNNYADVQEVEKDEGEGRAVAIRGLGGSLTSAWWRSSYDKSQGNNIKGTVESQPKRRRAPTPSCPPRHISTGHKEGPYHAHKSTIQALIPCYSKPRRGGQLSKTLSTPMCLAESWSCTVFLLRPPTTASSCSTDPLYDNCPPFAQRGRSREKEMESRVVCPAVTRLPGPCSPLSGLAPAVAEVPTLLGEGRGPGTWPDHSYCSWGGGLGRQGWEELGPGIKRGRGGEREGEQRGSRGVEDRARVNQSPSPSQSEQHRSALSLYDNLPDAVTPDSLQEVFDMEMSFQEHVQEQMYQAWAPEQIQGLMEGDAAIEKKSPWSSCEIILAEGGSSNRDQNPDQVDRDKKHEQEPELDSGSCGFKQGDGMLHVQLPVSPPVLTASSPPICPAECQAPWPPAEAQQREQPSWSPRVPPPVPLADPSASALRSLLTSLQQQIVRQRDEYEERIISLEQRNEELQVEVVQLKTNLAQQRHWYHVIQAKIVESERARAAAELRNATLQREMEQFFDTFGELNNEAKKTECIVKSF
ncbi:uncharacterized protein LOC121188948 [Toxotes jaculatrix]|uniref:uncharacterized protein LOC121188948 n=1 Tax=Toxotes jaculatrix TaxID=941984 RepID=UPI001B3AE39D|nr:uncharacterized protein LOC121188948 [Toxotes jaculatrix]